MLKTRVAAYLSGSRVLTDGPLSLELALTLSFVVATFALLFAFEFAFALVFPFFGGTHANATSAMIIMDPNPDRYLICRITHLMSASSGLTLKLDDLKGERLEDSTESLRSVGIFVRSSAPVRTGKKSLQRSVSTWMPERMARALAGPGGRAPFGRH